MAQQIPTRQHDRQFKMNAVELTLRGDKTTKAVADDFGVPV
jgi:transposase